LAVGGVDFKIISIFLVAEVFPLKILR
jgi:hypothetical protein